MMIEALTRANVYPVMAYPQAETYLKIEADIINAITKFNVIHFTNITFGVPLFLIEIQTQE